MEFVADIYENVINKRLIDRSINYDVFLFRFQLPFIYQYIIGLQKMASHQQTSFVWLPDESSLPMTYENFRWLPDSISDNNTIGICVYLDMDDSMKWRAFSCRDVIVSRGTICQIGETTQQLFS